MAKYEVAAEYIKAAHRRRELNFRTDEVAIKLANALRSKIFKGLNSGIEIVHLFVPQHWPYRMSLILEVSCILFLLLEFAAACRVFDWKRSPNHPYQAVGSGSYSRSALILRGLMILLTVVDMALYFFEIVPIRLTWFFIPLFIIFKRRHVRTLFFGCFKAGVYLLGVPTILLFLTFVWSAYGYFLFGGIECSWEVLCFGTFGSSFRLMLLSFLSRPVSLDILNTFGEQAGLSFFLLSYVLMTCLWLGAMIVAVANSHFKKYHEEIFKRRTAFQTEAVEKAFDLLKDQESNEISLPVWRGFHPYLALHGVSREDYEMILEDILREPDHLEGQLRKGCDAETFYKFVQFIDCPLQVSHSQDAEKPVSENTFLAFLRFQVRRIVDFQIKIRNLSIFPFTIFFYFLVIVLLLLQILHTHSATLASVTWKRNSLMIFALFWTETLLYSFAFGFKTYWKSKIHKVDVVINVLGLVYFAVYYPSNAPFHLFFLLRAFRVLRLVEPMAEFLPGVSDILQRAWLVFPAMIRTGFILFSIIYMFTVISYQMYFEEMDPDVITESKTLNQYAAAWLKYSDILCFNSFLQSLQTMFNVAFLSNWPVVMYAAKHSTSCGSYAEVLFILFRCFVTVYMIPILLGFNIQRFMKPNLAPRDDFTMNARATASYKKMLLKEELPALHSRRQTLRRRISQRTDLSRNERDRSRSGSHYLMEEENDVSQFTIGGRVITRSPVTRADTFTLLYS